MSASSSTTSTPGTGTNNNPADANTIGSTGISTDSSRPIHNRRTLEENNINNNNNSNSNNNNDDSSVYMDVDDIEIDNVELNENNNNENNNDNNNINDVNANDNDNNDVTLERIRDAIISENTMKVYIGDINQFIIWTMANQPDWITARGRILLDRIYESQLPGESNFAFHSRCLDLLTTVIRESD